MKAFKQLIDKEAKEIFELSWMHRHCNPMNFLIVNQIYITFFKLFKKCLSYKKKIVYDIFCCRISISDSARAKRGEAGSHAELRLVTAASEQSHPHFHGFNSNAQAAQTPTIDQLASRRTIPYRHNTFRLCVLCLYQYNARS